MIDRRAFIAGVAGVLLAPPLAVVAQVPGKVYRIGYLGQDSKSSGLADNGALGRLLQDLRALGYVEGTNLTVESRFADGRTAVLAALAAQLVQAKPDVIAVPSAGLADRDATEAAAARLGIRVRFVQFETIDNLNRQFEEMAREKDQALIVWGNPHLNLHRKAIFDLTIRYRLPAVYDVRAYPPDLMVYAAKVDEVAPEAATYVDRILKGANPGDLPIGQARSFELVINLKTAKVLGLTIPQSLLARADEVIQ